MTSKTCVLLALSVLVASTGGCTRKQAQAQARPEAANVGTTTTRASGIATVDVPDDKKVYVVDGNASVHRPIVYLHGMCADPRDDLEAWGGLAKDHGTIIAVVGDVPCPNKPGRTQWTNDAASIDERIANAVNAVARSRGTTFDLSEIVVIGESMGAARAETLATKFPDRYTRLVLVGSPETPSPDNLRNVKAVANLAGEKETQAKMRQGTRALDGAGTPVRFWELPGATHGEYGPEGQRIMSEAVAFVLAR